MSGQAVVGQVCVEAGARIGLCGLLMFVVSPKLLGKKKIKPLFTKSIKDLATI